MVLKVRQEIAEKVKENLEPNDYRKKEANNKKDEIVFDDNIQEEKKEIKNDINNNNNNNNNSNNKEINIDVNNNEKKEEKDDKKIDEIEGPQKFQIDKKAKINNVKVKGKAGKKNKIKKVDFDFDFDSFNDVNFSDFNKGNVF